LFLRLDRISKKERTVGMLNYWTCVCVTASDVCFEIDIIDIYIKRAASPVYRINGITISHLKYSTNFS
jgi:hypothetical protein